MELQKVLLILAATVMLCPSVLCNNAEERIVGGSEMNDGKHPYMVVMEFSSGRVCGGAIIDSYSILTAAQCLVNENSVDIYLGVHDLANETEPYREKRSISNSSETLFVVHDAYNSSTLVADIGLVLLPVNEPIVFDDKYKMNILLAAYEVEPGTDAIIQGYGVVSQDSQGNFVNVPFSATVETISTEACEDHYLLVDEMQLCVDSSAGKSPCKGDAGSPLTDQLRNELFGVASFTSLLGCESGAPAAYTSVAQYMDFIEDNARCFAAGETPDCDLSEPVH